MRATETIFLLFPENRHLFLLIKKWVLQTAPIHVSNIINLKYILIHFKQPIEVKLDNFVGFVLLSLFVSTSVFVTVGQLPPCPRLHTDDLIPERCAVSTRSWDCSTTQTTLSRAGYQNNTVCSGSSRWWCDLWMSKWASTSAAAGYPRPRRQIVPNSPLRNFLWSRVLTGGGLLFIFFFMCLKQARKSNKNMIINETTTYCIFHFLCK